MPHVLNLEKSQYQRYRARRDQCGTVIGHLDEAELIALNRMLALVIGIAG